jgi:hypothetical protein
MGSLYHYTVCKLMNQMADAGTASVRASDDRGPRTHASATAALAESPPDGDAREAAFESWAHAEMVIRWGHAESRPARLLPEVTFWWTGRRPHTNPFHTPALLSGSGARRSGACRVLGVGKAATWLILPVVICLSQRLSHACLSINCFIL